MDPWSVGFTGTLEEESNHMVLFHTVELTGCVRTIQPYPIVSTF